MCPPSVSRSHASSQKFGHRRLEGGVVGTIDGVVESLVGELTFGSCKTLDRLAPIEIGVLVVAHGPSRTAIQCLLVSRSLDEHHTRGHAYSGAQNARRQRRMAGTPRAVDTCNR